MHAWETHLRRKCAACGALCDTRAVSEELRKLVVFVPADALDAVRDAVFAAGAGRIGAYERCSWYTEGTGTFLGGGGGDPPVGAAGGEGGVPPAPPAAAFPRGC